MVACEADAFVDGHAFDVVVGDFVGEDDRIIASRELVLLAFVWCVALWPVEGLGIFPTGNGAKRE